MRVFKACFQIMSRKMGALAIYVVIFMALSVLLTDMSAQQLSTDFTAEKPTFTIIDRDGDTPITQGLRRYLSQNGTEVPLKDEIQVLQDATFYRASDYIVIIPQGFAASFLTAAPLQLQTVTTPNSARGYYADSLASQYLQMVRSSLLADPGADPVQVVETAISDLGQHVQVTTRQFGEAQPVSESYHIFFRMQSYILMVMVMLCLSTVTIAFGRPDLRRRNLCSPMNAGRLNGQLSLYSLIISLFCWLLLTLLGFVVYRRDLAVLDMRLLGLMLLNALVFTLVAMAISMLAGIFMKSPNTQNAVANFVSLGLSFLGGVFVPLEYLGQGMLAVAHFTPTYWYSVALNRICKISSFSGGVPVEIWQAMGVQLGFAAALLCIALVMAKYAGRSERALQQSHTELQN